MAAPVCWCFTLSFGLGFAAAQTPAPVLTVPNLDKNGIEDICFTGGNQKYLVTNGSDDDVKFWEPGTGRLVKKLTFGDYSHLVHWHGRLPATCLPWQI